MVFVDIFGVIATLIFGALSIYYVKSKKYPGQITYIEEQSIGLFNSLVKNFPQISINYDNSTISEQIVLLKGHLLNTGNIDIKESMIEKKLTISLPEHYKFLIAKVIGGTEGNNFSIVQPRENILEVDFGLFKKNEYLSFETLIEVPIDDSKKEKISPDILVSKNISFLHRIADTSKVKHVDINLSSSILSDFNFLLRKLLLFPLAIITIISFNIILNNKINTSFLKNYGQFTYEIKTPSNDTIFVHAYPETNNNMVYIEGVETKYKRTISLNTFLNQYLINTKILKDPSVKSTIYIFDILALLSLIMLTLIGVPTISQILERRKIKQIKSILGINN